MFVARATLPLLAAAGCLADGQLRGSVVNSTAVVAAESAAMPETFPEEEKEGEADLDVWTLEASGPGEAWEVVRVSFLDPAGYEITPGTAGCSVRESGHSPDTTAANAFRDDDTIWKGTWSVNCRCFSIGIACAGAKKIALVRLQQRIGIHTKGTLQLLHNHQAVATRDAWGDVQATFQVRDTWLIRATGRTQFWDVERVRFVRGLTEGGELTPSDDSSCDIVASGHEGEMEAINAFKDGALFWRGRRDASGHLYIGITCSLGFWYGYRSHTSSAIAAVSLKQVAGHTTDTLHVEHNGRPLERWDHPELEPRVGQVDYVWKGLLGLRLKATKLQSGREWDVRRMKVVVPSGDILGSSLMCWPVHSGPTGPEPYDIENAFMDNQAYWRGLKEDGREDPYIGITCRRPFVWPPLSNISLDEVGEHFASEVEVQQETVDGWGTIATLKRRAGEGLVPLGTAAPRTTSRQATFWP